MKERKSWLLRWIEPYTSRNSALPLNTQGLTQSPQYKRGRVANDWRSKKSVLTGQDKTTTTTTKQQQIHTHTHTQKNIQFLF